MWIREILQPQVGENPDVDDLTLLVKVTRAVLILPGVGEPLEVSRGELGNYRAAARWILAGCQLWGARDPEDGASTIFLYTPRLRNLPLRVIDGLLRK